MSDVSTITQWALIGADIESYREHIEALPKEDQSTVFGLHDNVNISAAIKEGSEILGTVLSLQPRTSGGMHVPV